MNVPFMAEPFRVAEDTDILPAFLPVPGLGSLAVNAFVVKAEQPLLVDTGLAGLREAFLERVRQLIDPQALRWIWITHADPDHVGNLTALLAEAPNARVVTTFLGMGKMNLLGLPVDRAYLLNPGQHLDLGDREIQALVPPSYDAPETTALFDRRSKALFSSDCFGALLEAPAAEAKALSAERLREGVIAWSGIDAPWLHHIDRDELAGNLRRVIDLKPECVLSAHLPPAEGMAETLCEWLSQARDADPFRGPDQQQLEVMMKSQAAA